MADELDAGNALQGDPTDIVIEAGEVVTPTTEVVVEAETPVVEETTLAEDKPHHLKGKTPWYMERINEETNKRREIEGQLAQERREKQEARALLERMQGGDKAAPAQADDRNIDALVKAEAARLVFEQERQAVISAGHQEFGAEGFSQIASILGAAGAATEDFIQDVIAVDKANAHLIFDVLAKDPERARALSNMDLRRRTAELTRISDKMTDSKAAAVVPPKVAAPSKVPAPRPVIEAIRPPEDTPEDEMTDAQWSAWRKKQSQKIA